MKELYQELPEVVEDERKNFIIDTCFLIDCIKNNKIKDIERLSETYDLVLVDLNFQELDHIHLDDDVKIVLRKMLKEKLFYKYHTGVNIGNWDDEEQYVKFCDKELLKIISDKSDAVIVAAAEKINAHVMTKDKHHLFTSELENYINKKGIRIFKELKDVR